MRLKDLATLQEIVITKVDEGGSVADPCQWETICITANEMLVPDSEKSHTSAGAEVDDEFIDF